MEVVLDGLRGNNSFQVKNDTTVDQLKAMIEQRFSKFYPSRQRLTIKKGGNNSLIFIIINNKNQDQVEVLRSGTLQSYGIQDGTHSN